MEIYAVFRQPDYDTLTDTSTLFWGAALFVALVALFFLVGKAIERLRNRSKPPNESSGQAISRPSADGYGNALGNFASMIASGHDDSSSAPRKRRKATKARRRARG
jgi:hypothetical protein